MHMLQTKKKIIMMLRLSHHPPFFLELAEAQTKSQGKKIHTTSGALTSEVKSQYVSQPSSAHITHASGADRSDKSTGFFFTRDVHILASNQTNT